MKFTFSHESGKGKIIVHNCADIFTAKKLVESSLWSGFNNAPIFENDTLNPTDYTTDMDNLPSPDYAKNQYTHVIESAKQLDYFTISWVQTWGGGTLDHKTSLTTYEKLGYHSQTSPIVQAMIDSKLPIIDFRELM